MSELCKLWVNNREIEADGDRKLIDVLRNDLRLKSVKDGCSEGACGTCTVVIDGKATKTCVQKVSRMAGKHVLTVEGLSQREKDVFVYAFGEAGAVQCGFCIPGMVMCGKALIDANPSPSRLEIAAAIRNNICRCTGYKKIIDAIAMAADLLRTGQAAAATAVSAILASASMSKPRSWVSASIRMTWMPSICPVCVMAVPSAAPIRGLSSRLSIQKRPRPCPVSSVS